ncbi:MAG: hypothetical protein ACTSRW_05055 [Candidatus Helarchaeota archaeon]
MKEKEPISEEEIKKKKFRITCVNPTFDGAIELDNPIYQLCGHGHGMDINEINKNLIWRGKPYIRIPYCKYCYSEETVGVFDDTPQMLGWSMNLPSDENPYFVLKKNT